MNATAPDMATVMHVRRDAGADAELIRRSWREPDRFAEIFDRYYAAIHGFAARRLGASLAADVASETFLIAFDRRRRYDVAQPDARPWLYGIASNLIARHHRAVVRDATIDPAKAGNATGEVKKGEKVIAERIAAAVVDEPGDRP